MTISKVEPDLRQIIQNLHDGNLEKAKDRTVELIESAFRMSGPMYREETTQDANQRMSQNVTKNAPRKTFVALSSSHKVRSPKNRGPQLSHSRTKAGLLFPTC